VSGRLRDEQPVGVYWPALNEVEQVPNEAGGEDHEVFRT
jgi:hypothetical protein